MTSIKKFIIFYENSDMVTILDKENDYIYLISQKLVATGYRFKYYICVFDKEYYREIFGGHENLRFYKTPSDQLYGKFLLTKQDFFHMLTEEQQKQYLLLEINGDLE